MGSVVLLALLLAGTAMTAPLTAQAPGEGLFNTSCAACHSLGPDRRLGPGLSGLFERRDHEWLLRKITEPDRLVAERDPITAELVAEHGMAMVNLGISLENAEAILSYLAEVGSGEPASTPAEQGAAAVEHPEFDETQVARGQALFEGSARFENRGVSCNGCHEVAHTGVLGGGSLAAELTDAYSRLGPAALEGMMRNPPFPVMARPFRDRPITEDEIEALVAFLHRADAERTEHGQNAYGLVLAGAGTAGTLLLMGLFTVVWRGRRRGSINQEIFDRQVKSR